MSSLKKKVKSLEKKYFEAARRLRQFEDENIELMEELQRLSIIRNEALMALDDAMRKARIDAGGMKVSISSKQTYDGKKLYDHFSATDVGIRDALVEVKYAVNTTQFKSLLVQGRIPEELRDEAVLKDEDVVKVLRKPKPYYFG